MQEQLLIENIKTFEEKPNDQRENIITTLFYMSDQQINIPPLRTETTYALLFSLFQMTYENPQYIVITKHIKSFINLNEIIPPVLHQIIFYSERFIVSNSENDLELLNCVIQLFRKIVGEQIYNGIICKEFEMMPSHFTVKLQHSYLAILKNPCGQNGEIIDNVLFLFLHLCMFYAKNKDTDHLKIVETIFSDKINVRRNKEDFDFFIKHQIGIVHILFRFLTSEEQKQKLMKDYFELFVIFIENIQNI